MYLYFPALKEHLSFYLGNRIYVGALFFYYVLILLRLNEKHNPLAAKGGYKIKTGISPVGLMCLLSAALSFLGCINNIVNKFYQFLFLRLVVIKCRCTVAVDCVFKQTSSIRCRITVIVNIPKLALFHLVVFVCIFSPFLSEGAFATGIEYMDKFQHGRMVLREFIVNDTVTRSIFLAQKIKCVIKASTKREHLFENNFLPINFNMPTEGKITDECYKQCYQTWNAKRFINTNERWTNCNDYIIEDRLHNYGVSIDVNSPWPLFLFFGFVIFFFILWLTQNVQYSTGSGLTIDICEKISLLHGAGLVF